MEGRTAAAQGEPASGQPCATHGSLPGRPEPISLPVDEVKEQRPAVEPDAETADEPLKADEDGNESAAEGIAAAEVLVAAAREVRNEQESSIQSRADRMSSR